MNTKIDDMPNSILDALRRDRAEERRLTEKRPQTQTQPPPASLTTIPTLMKRAKDLGPPIDPPAVGGSTWVVKKEDGGTRVPLHVFVTAVPGPQNPNFTVLAYQQDGSLNTTAPYQCCHDNFLLETEARNLATIA